MVSYRLAKRSSSKISFTTAALPVGKQAFTLLRPAIYRTNSTASRKVL
ncbi:MAG: hypothetical protein LBC74_07130 [Planctomycetaceae bacterium]|nr:hypothetical protein [Planctomycetaceae bacterium]